MTGIEEKHPFAVRLGWVALLVTMAMLILGIYFERHLSSANDAIRKNTVANTHLNQKIQEEAWISCRDLRTERFVTINNDKAQETLNDYFRVIIQNSLTAATIAAADKSSGPAAQAAARQRIQDARKFLAKIPKIIIPKPVPPCGPDPYPGLKLLPPQKGNAQ